MNAPITRPGEPKQPNGHQHGTEDGGRQSKGLEHKFDMLGERRDEPIFRLTSSRLTAGFLSIPDQSDVVPMPQRVREYSDYHAEQKS